MLRIGQGAAGIVVRGLAMAALATGTLTGCGGKGGSDALPAGAGVPPRDVGPRRLAAECPQVAAVGDSPARQLRGMWIATVQGTDWPTQAGAPADRQKAEYLRLLNTATELNLNAVFFQVRPAGDAFYPSGYEPWSQWLTGTQGGNPGYDVLKFLIDEAHKRNLEFHAWFNPYRAAVGTDRSALAASSPARLHPKWAVSYGSQLWYDPGLPQVRDLATKVVMDVVGRYDIDGVHLDDYFYPYPSGSDFPDGASYATYGAGLSRGDWRRRNVDLLVQGLSAQIHQAKAWVKFGISPFGVWRNSDSDPAGSRTHALQSYDDIFADTRGWVKKGWLDYVTPQLYWPLGDPRADYATLVAWWSGQVAGTGVQLSIGQAGYRVGQDSTWSRAGELSHHLTVNGRYPQVRGDVFFSAGDLLRNKAGFAALVRTDHYTSPAIIPVIPGRGGSAPQPAYQVHATVAGTTVSLAWSGADATSYAIYRVAGTGAGCAAVDPRALLATVRAGTEPAGPVAAGRTGGAAITDPTVKPGMIYTYYVTALDRLHHESAPARGVTVTVPRG